MLNFPNFFVISPVLPTSINYPNYSGSEEGGLKLVLTLPSELEIWSFHVVDLQRTEKKCTNFTPHVQSDCFAH